ncbi:MAG: hypothetical protein FK734_08925 [Asgard group archaeon]|nr:hypothetical protein [Asgard group archaeon]
MNEKELREIAKELLLKAQPAYLATIDENGLPQIRAVENLRNPTKFPHDAKILQEYEEDDIVPYISTNTSSKKINQLLKNNSAAMYFCSPDEYKGIMLQGFIEFVEDMDLKKRLWQDSMLRYYPQGFTDPDYTMLRLKPIFAKTWYKSRKNEIVLSDE